jgi:hypothetical protein
MGLEDEILDFHKKNKKQKVSILLISLFLFVLLIGYFFAIMHWPFSSELMILSLSFFNGYLIAKSFFVSSIFSKSIYIVSPLILSFMMNLKMGFFNSSLFILLVLSILFFTLTFVFSWRIKKYNESI